MDIEIRAAGPDDVQAIVPLIFSSGPATFDYVFSHRTRANAKEFLARTFPTGKGEFGYRRHYAAVCAGEVVGCGAYNTGQDSFANTRQAIPQILSCYGLLTGLAVMRRGLLVEQIVRPPKGNRICILHIGVDPAYWGRGIGGRIVSHLLELGRQQGRSVAELDVVFENARAQTLYERLGFKVTDEHESTLYNSTSRVPGFRRMELALR